MDHAAHGGTVQVTLEGAAVTGGVGTVVHLGTSGELRLVRVGAAVQGHVPPQHLELCAP